jgi:hypothetical protein
MDKRIVMISGIAVVVIVLLVVAGALIFGGDDGSDDAMSGDQVFTNMYNSCLSIALARAGGDGQMSEAQTTKVSAYCQCAVDLAKAELTPADLAALDADQTAEPAASTLQKIIATCKAKWLQ